jgi:CDP-paratose 2-epimerase
MSHHYLITGGAGFIGSNLANHYLSAGRRVTLFDNFSRAGSEVNLAWLQAQHGGRVEVIRGDIRDAAALELAVEGAEVVFHLAAQVAVTTSVTDPRHDHEVNALGTFNVLEAVRKSASRPIVLYSSTNKVYGKMADLAVVERGSRYEYEDPASGVTEDRPLDFYSPYGCSKGAGDQYTIDYARIYGLRTVVMRQSCIYGPRQFGIEDQGWLAWFAICALAGMPISIFGDGKQVRDALFIHDLIAAYDGAIRNIAVTSGRAYNVGGGPRNTISLLELIELLEKRFGRTLPRTFGEPRPGDQLVFVSDIGRAKADFGWEPKTGVAAGVDALADWLIENRNLIPACAEAQPMAVTR